MKLFAVENVITGMSLAVEAHYTNLEAAIEMTPRVAHLDECRLWFIANYDERTRVVTPVTPELVEWDNRRLRPVTPSKNIESGDAAVKSFQKAVEESVQETLSH